MAQDVSECHGIELRTPGGPGGESWRSDAEIALSRLELENASSLSKVASDGSATATAQHQTRESGLLEDSVASSFLSGLGARNRRS